jgi:hypothetical protein
MIVYLLTEENTAMRYRNKMMTAVVLTIIVCVLVASSTESIRDYLYFTWQVQEGDEFIFEVSVEGYTETGHVFFPVAQAVLNNTRLKVRIISLPSDSIISDGTTFAEYVIEHMKTNVSFEDGTPLPLNLVFEMNNLVSRSFLPKGSWNLVDSFYPNNLVQPINSTAESYISAILGDSFYLGHILYDMNDGVGWSCTCSMDTGIPSSVMSWAWSYGGLVEYSYNVTLTIVD